MAEYIIHGCETRKSYIDDYLVPSMVEQGISRDNIIVYIDHAHEGNLRSWIRAGLKLPEKGGTWHLQDDVIIAKDFKQKTEQYDNGIVCAFSSMYDEHLPCGEVSVRDMWFSFLCIRIPNKIAVECARWIRDCIIGNYVYHDWWKKGVNDDMLFRQYVWQFYKDEKALNLAPNLVDHIDYLIGGTQNSNSRKKTVIRSKYWEDEQLVIDLEKRLTDAIGGAN